MIKHLISGISTVLLSLCGLHTFAQGTSEHVNVVNPGTLRELINDLSTTRISSLTITGSINGEDVAYLVGGAGRMSKIDSLDISAIKLVGDNQPYRTLLVDRSYEGFGTTTEVYYLSEKDTVIYESSSTGLGGAAAVHHVFCKDLSGAFAENESFKHIVMPQDLSRIGNYQFFKNPSVVSVILPPKASVFGRRAFDGASALTSLTIPDGIVSIPERSVRCTSLERVVLPASVDSVYRQAFEGSPIADIDLKNVRFAGVSAFSGNKFKGVLDLSSLEQMGTYAFYASGGNEVDSIIFSDKLRAIPANAFAGFGLTSLILPDGIEEIGSWAFGGCSKLVNVVLPPYLQQVYNNSFSNTPWQNALKGENGVIYAGTIALQYDFDTAPKGSEFAFKDGTTIIADADVNSWAFFPTYLSDWAMDSVYLPPTLKRIGSAVFSGCKDLKSISLPEGLLSIGENSFSGCESLHKINLPEGITEIPAGAFQNCSSLEDLILPKGVERIGENAFSGDGLLYLTMLPDSLKVIEEKSFAGCKAIPFLTLPEKLDSIGSQAFVGCSGIETVNIRSKNLIYAYEIFGGYKNYNNSIYKVNVAPGVTTLPARMFQLCSGITKLVFEDIESSSLTKIEDYCFDRCKKLEIAELPASLEYIGGHAFYEAIGVSGTFELKNISYVGYSAFSGWSGITELIISAPNMYIGRYVFDGCSSLKTVKILSETLNETNFEESMWGYPLPFYNTRIETVEIGPSLKEIPDGLFSDISTLRNVVFHERVARGSAMPLVVGKNAFRYCNLESLELPEGTVSIGEDAFASNSNLETIVIPGTCESLGEYAFVNCGSVQSLAIGEGLRSLGEYAFSGCLSLPSVVLPSTCEEIGTEAFRRCDVLQSLTILSETPPSFGASLGYGINPLILVPEKSLDAYKALPVLSSYRVEPLPDSAIDDIEVDKTSRNIMGVYGIDGRYVGNGLESVNEPGVYIVRYSDGTSEKILYSSARN